MNQITRGLLDRGISVKVMAIAPSGSESTLGKVTRNYIKETGFEFFPVNTRVRPVSAFFNLFSGKSYNITRFYCSKLATRLAELLKQESFDIIQLEGLYLTPYIHVIRQHTGAPLLFRSHNIEHFIWERMAASARNPLKRLYLKILTARLRKYEMRTVHQVDGLIAISPVDMRFFEKNGFSHPAVTIPVGIGSDMAAFEETVPEANTIFHLGSMDWRPNQDGISWFIEKVWPIIKQRNPEIRFVLAGKNIPEQFYNYHGGNIIVAGEVPDAAKFMQEHALMVVPLRSGGGMRVKIVEGMAAGKAIVSTSIGAEGIDCTHGENILLADTPMEMAESVLYCFSNPAFIKTLGKSARVFALENHLIEPIIEKLTGFYSTFLEN